MKTNLHLVNVFLKGKHYLDKRYFLQKKQKFEREMCTMLNKEFLSFCFICSLLIRFKSFRIHIIIVSRGISMIFTLLNKRKFFFFLNKNELLVMMKTLDEILENKHFFEKNFPLLLIHN
jgi:hypothetical protein